MLWSMVECWGGVRNTVDCGELLGRCEKCWGEWWSVGENRGMSKSLGNMGESWGMFESKKECLGVRRIVGESEEVFMNVMCLQEC